jgi:hypothetical protein
MISQVLIDYFRCPPGAVDFRLSGSLSKEAGYFRFGGETICYGRSSAGSRSPKPDAELHDVLGDVRAEGGAVCLPFDPTEVACNLRQERYMRPASGAKALVGKLVREIYYLFRPLLPVHLRKHLQKAYLKGGPEASFPHWPVDTTIESLMERLLLLAVEAKGGERVPFIWFWPRGMNACAVMTHDVETQLGVELSVRLMDMNDRFGVSSSFQVVPEQRYIVTEAYLESLRCRGFEVNIHDLNHDGHLFRERREFERRMAKINRYGKQFGAAGFRAAVLYRNQEWFDQLEFDYDMSVPNAAKFDPQRGGCCTLMPYFVGNVVELPVTLIQDYSLFHILNDYTTTIWEQQLRVIMERHGLANVIVHPDYITGPREEKVYNDLLAMLARLREEQNLWVALPREVSSWWRQRSQMTLVQEGGEWRIEGPGHERAQVAFASIEGGRLMYNSPAFHGLHATLQPSH